MLNQDLEMFTKTGPLGAKIIPGYERIDLSQKFVSVQPCRRCEANAFVRFALILHAASLLPLPDGFATRGWEGLQHRNFKFTALINLHPT
jgi:hypothetical protein